jgi:two-component system osmolarity sensor histidine kinase EnvZ
MFYGLSNFVKKIMPKRLFYRSLIIVATPIILLQIIITVVFFDSLWIKANKGMTRSLVGEVQTMFDVYKKGDANEQEMIINLYNKNFDFIIVFKENELVPTKKAERWFSPIDRSLRRELKPVFDSFWFDTTSYKELVDLRIKYKNGALQIFFPRHKNI